MVTRISLLTVAALAALAICLSSCSSIQEPVIRLEGVDLVGISTDGLELMLQASLENPNDFGADIDELEYKILGDGVELARGSREMEIRVGAGETVEIGVPFDLKWSSGKTILKGILDGEEHDWQFEGSVGVKKGPIRTTFAFSESGSINSPDQSQDL